MTGSVEECAVITRWAECCSHALSMFLTKPGDFGNVQKLWTGMCCVNRLYPSPLSGTIELKENQETPENEKTPRSSRWLMTMIDNCPNFSLGARATLVFGPYEIKTLRIGSRGAVRSVNLMEENV